MKALLSGQPLRNRADKLGVSFAGLQHSEPSITGDPNSLNDGELQRRVMEAERHKREASLWLVALISAIASVISAITAFCAVLMRHT
jgi:hypothetical protein